MMVSNVQRNFKHPVMKQADAGQARLITADELIEAAAPYNHVAQLYWRGLNIFVRSAISMQDAIMFTDTVMQRCWSGKDYDMVLFDFYFRAAVVAFYSNLMLPQEEPSAWTLLYETDLYDKIYEHINVSQVGMLRDAIKMSISN